MYDITIQNAIIVDGTGLPAFRADIAIKGDRIAAIGKLDVKAKHTINAHGRTVIPGIIDPHSHADLILPLAPKRQTELMRCKLAQGVTTTVIGNCGLGCAPVANGEAEGILRAVNAWMTPEPVEWKWRTVGEYLDRIESNGMAMNIATLAPHGPVRISAMGLAKGSPSKTQMKKMLAMEEEAEREGLRVSFDMFPYTAATTMMIAIYPPWALEGGVDRLIERLKDRKTRRRIERDIERQKPSWPPWREGGWPHNLVGATGWDSIFIGYVDSRRNKRYEERSLAELSQMTGKRPFDAISDLIIEERGQVSMLIFEISGERDERDLLGKYARHRLSAFCTDAEDYGRGLPHPAAYGAFARILSKYVREDRALTLEEAVRKMTSYPARIFGLKDRGVIRPGAFADLTVFDPGRVNDRASFEKPRREAAGIEMVIVNGRVAFENNQTMSKSPGAVIRNSV